MGWFPNGLTDFTVDLLAISRALAKVDFWNLLIFPCFWDFFMSYQSSLKCAEREILETALGFSAYSCMLLSEINWNAFFLISDSL